jgi:hypothetical protein
MSVAVITGTSNLKSSRGSGAQRTSASELSARPPALAIGLPVALLGGLSVGGLLLLEFALARPAAARSHHA